MMHLKIPMMAAPVGLQPGAYVPKAYGDLVAPVTPSVELFVEQGPTWRVRMRWVAPQPIRALDGDPGRFVDACAILTEEKTGTPWMTMGAPGQPVVGALWRADRERLYGIRAEGLGSVVRSEPVPEWSVRAMWANAQWEVTLELGGWPALTASQKIALAVWQGTARERAGLKSVSRDWIPLSGGPHGK